MTSDWRPHEPSLEATRATIIDRVVAIVRRPVRFTGDTLEIFDADAKEQVSLLKKLGNLLDEACTNVLFYTREESRRLYADFVDHFPHHCHYTVEVNFDGKRKFFCDLCGRAF